MYLLKADRTLTAKREREPEETQLDIEPSDTNINITEGRRRVRSRTSSGMGDSSGFQDLKCIVCDKARETTGDRERMLFRFCEKESARDFIDAFTIFDDDVARRCVLMKTEQDIWANDVLYHKNCLKKYMRRYRYKCSLVLNALEKAEERLEVDTRVASVFDALSSELNSGYGISLSHITGLINDGLEEHLKMKNRNVKVLLSKHFGESVCFTIPAQRNKSTMVYSSHLMVGSVIEATRQTVEHSYKNVAEELRSECKNYDFGLQDTYCTSEDLKLSEDEYQKNRPQKWLAFMEALFPMTSGKNSKEWLLKFDMAFQFFHYWITRGNFTPIHCSIAHTFDDLTKCRQIIDMCNRLNLCVSYDTMKRLTTACAERIAEDSKPFNCPLPSVIDDSSPIQGAMDNFDHIEITPSGKDSSHDTVLVIFQNKHCSQQLPPCEKTRRDSSMVNRKFKEVLPCQILQQSGLIKNTACLPDGFAPSDNKPAGDEEKQDVSADFMLWCQSRSLSRADCTETDVDMIPSFTALQSCLQNPSKFHATSTAFIPILPYKATEMDSIFTTMLNFQDVLAQRSERVGALWCDEGVYAVAKEIQILKPDIFSNIFLGLGPFHMEKIVMACLGKFLDCVGIDTALVEAGLFGPDVVASKVMNGKHYIKSKEGMMMIAEAMSNLLFKAFKDNVDCGIVKQLLEEYAEAIHKALVALENEENAFKIAWEEAKIVQQEVNRLYKDWKSSNMSDQNLEYWVLFLEEIYPVLRDLTHSIRIADWSLYVNAVSRSIPLFFGFGRVNYARYTPLFLNDCLELELKKPELYKHFMEGGWVYNYGQRKGSAIGFDMGLEKCYNKPAKSAAGIIGITAQKEAVALWNIVRHEKSLHTSNTLTWCGFNEDKDSELDLHHEFRPSSAMKSNARVQQLIDYIDQRGNPFNGATRLRDICKVVTVPQNVVLGIVKCLDVGKRSYSEFIQFRFVEKTLQLHSPIQTNKSEVFPKPIAETQEATETMQTKMIKKTKDISAAMYYLDAAKDREYDMKKLLKYEITSTSYFLVTEKDGVLVLKKGDKSVLSRELISKVPKQQQNIQLRNSDIDMTVVDFMGVVRKLPVKKLNLKTYGDLASALKNEIVDKSRGSSRIDIIFDVYRTYSTKHSERSGRCNTGTGGITVSIKDEKQNLPVNMDLFWDSMENKSQLQMFFMNWMSRNYKGRRELYFGGVDDRYCIAVKGGIREVCEDLHSTQEEADERIALHIQHGYQNGYKNLLVKSADTDVFVLLLFHLQCSWDKMETLYMTLGNQGSRKTFPLHLLLTQIDKELILNLPALHSLSGCDTTSKVGSKLACFTKPLDLELLSGFGTAQLTEEMISNAETLLLQTLLRASDEDVTSFDEFRYRQHYDDGVNDFNRLVCTTSTIREHIRRSYYQTMRWVKSTSPPATFPDPASGYGFKASQDGKVLVPNIIINDSVPDDLPLPCTCTSCVRSTCRCRVACLPCCRLCKCKPSTGRCKNPLS